MHTNARLTVFMHAFCHLHVENLLKGPVYKTNILSNHLSNMTSNLFFCFPNEKNLSKTTTAELYPVKKWEAVYKKQMSLQLYLLYCYLIMQSLCNAFWIPNPGSWIQICWITSRSMLFQPFIALKLIK